MRPIRDIGAVRPSSVLYHSAFGFARVSEVEPASVLLDWEGEGENLPGRVAHDVLMRVYALCPEHGFFDRAMNDREGLVELLAGKPVEALALLLGDLIGAQTRKDLEDWIVGRGLMTTEAASRWWETLRPVIEEDERFTLEADTVQLAREEEAGGPEARLRNPALSPSRRLDLAIAHRNEISREAFLENLVLAWKLGGSQVRDLALQAAADIPPVELLQAMVAPGPDGIEAIIHLIRRASWGPNDLPESAHALLLDRVVKGCDAGGPLDNEGRLAATLARWESPGIVETLADLASTPDGKRLCRATLAALPPRRAESLAIDLLATALQSEAVEAATWLSSELLGIALVDQESMADRLDDDHPELAEWFRHTFQGVPERGLTAGYDDTDDSTAHTAEIDLSEAVEGPIPLSKLPPRSGASLLGLGLALSRALAVHHKDGVVCNPSADRTLVLPSETMEVAPGDAGDIPRPAGEPPSTAADVYTAAVLLLECLLGRKWPRHIPAQRAVPYLRYVIPLLPPAALAPLDAALHPEPSLRPRDGLAWQALWQVAAIAEEKRGYAQRDPAARLQIGYDSHIGRTKVLLTQTNQDALFVSTKGPLSLLVVCDGISTANAGTGDVASSIASHVIANLWEQALPRLVQAEPAEIREFLDRALKMANQAVCEAALRFAGGNLDGRVPMGTTAVVSLVYGNRVWLAWLGDSRAYLVGPYGASLLTFDENQASERLRAWHLNFIEQWDPAGFALVGYLGHFDEMSRAEALPAHHFSFTLVPGERLMLCSDGVTDYLGDTHPEAALFVADAVRDDDPFECARNLVAQANRGGGGDNITTVVARLWEQ
ncbi:MAG: protein phosphatase 2C domain-containing protein [Alphaproteobacteria bacterium]|nr:protein phosphatase 2C domain-containing protein [Alphaproteobacteria bacterium]